MQNIHAQIPNWLWAKDAWGNNNVEGISTATDGSGNVYVAGYFKYGPINFDTIQLTGYGDYDCFLAKYDFNGNFLWAKTIGGNSIDKVYDVKIDNNGNALITGFFLSPTMNIGTFTLNNNGGGSDMFLIKYDVNGNELWVLSEGALSFGGAEGNSIITDNIGNIFVTGKYIFYPIIFGADTLVNTLGYDLFIVKYDSNGSVIWANSANASGDEKPAGIALDNFGDIYIAGNYYNSNLIFGTDTLVHAAPINTDNRFVLKFANNGSKVWARSVGGAFGGGSCTDIIKDNNGDILVSGSSIIKYDINGNVIWTTAAGVYLYGEGIAIDNFNNIYITGSFNSQQIIFGPDTLTAFGISDPFIAKYDFNGIPLRATKMGGMAQDGAKSIAIDFANNVIVTGSYKSMYFYPLGLSNGSSGVYNYMYVAKTSGLISGLYERGNIEENINVYPNPSVGNFHINLRYFPNNKTILTLRNLMGQKLNEIVLTTKESELKLDEPNGIYFLTVSNGKENYSTKIIIQR